MNALAIFDPITARMAEYKAENEMLVFDYEDPQGNKDARSHVFKLRKVKTKIAEAHKLGKAEALAACREIDDYKNKLIGDVDEMIAVHNDPLVAIENERKEAEAKALRRIEEAQAKAEAERLAELEAREAAVKAAEEKARAEALKQEAEKEAVRADAERIEREKRIAEEAKIKAEADAKKALEDAECRRLADIEAVKAKAKAEADARELRDRQDRAAELELKERMEYAEKKRQENKKHQAKVQDAIIGRLVELGVGDCVNKVFIAMRDGTIPHVKIEY